MKISILKESLCIGGTERSASNISLALSKNNEVAMVLYDGDNIAYPYGGKLFNMQLPSKKKTIGKIINNIKRARFYIHHVNSFNPDIAFQFVSVNSPISRIKLKKTVKIVSSRDFAALSERTQSYKKMLDSSDAMICNSNYLKDFFVEKYPEDKEKVFAIHNIIDADYISQKSTEDIEEKFIKFRDKYSKVIVSVGRFCKEKGFEHLIEAFSIVQKTMPDTGLVFIGDGEYKQKYQEIIKNKNLEDKVYFTGYQQNPYKYMAKCDAFVLSSLSEGFPNVLAEAMALSMPVIAVNCFTGPAEILMKNYSYLIAKDSFEEVDFGILTPHYNIKGVDFAVEQMAKAICTLLKSDDLIKKYKIASAERVVYFSPSEATKKMEELFEFLISGRV